jgi:glycerophosphoryl diester phosphodiesterase
MKIVGHRGARGLAPENTIAGLKKGLEHHVDELEFDLRVTSDNVVVLSHDANLHDAAGNELQISTHIYKELKSHKADLATFEEVLSTFAHTVPLYVEVKKNEPTEQIVKIMKNALKTGWKTEDFRLGSYSQPILRTLHRELPDIQKVVIENWSGIRATWRARQLQTKRISMLEYWLWSGFIASMARNGYELYCFPPKDRDKEIRYAKIGLTGYSNNPIKARRWAKYGLSGVVTDYPDRFET